MKKIALYPGTFDPITKGHVDIILRAAKLFDQVIIAVASSSRKSPLIPTEQRIALVDEVFKAHANIRVSPLSGLVVDMAHEKSAHYMVRGLRSSADFDYEYQLAGMNRQLSDKIETVFLAAKPKNAFISSTIVREIIALKGDASAFIPEEVLQYLESRD